jgi:hypothetical protein
MTLMTKPSTEITKVRVRNRCIYNSSERIVDYGRAQVDVDEARTEGYGTDDVCINILALMNDYGTDDDGTERMMIVLSEVA